MKRQSLVISAIFLLNTILSFLAQVLLTRFFGVATEFENFLLAVTIPTILVTTVYATVNDSFLPRYSGERTSQDSILFFSSHIWLYFFLSSVVSILLAAFSPIILVWLFGQSGAADQVQHFFIALLSVFPIATVCALFGSRAYAEKRTILFPIAQMTGALVNVIIIATLYSVLGIWAVILGFFWNTAVQIFFVGGSIKMYLRLSDVIPTLWLLLPLVVGTFALRADGIIIRVLSSEMESGAVVHVNVMYRILAMAAGIATIGLQTALFPRLVGELQDGHTVETRALIVKAKIASILCGVLVVGGVWIVGLPLLGLILVGGKFSPSDWAQVVSYLPYFVLPTIGWAALTTFFQPLYAVRKHWTVGSIGVISLVITLLVLNILRAFTVPPIEVLSVSLSSLLFTGCVLAELAWQHYMRSEKS